MKAEPMEAISVDDVMRCMSPHVRMYSWHKPVYQHVVLTNLRRLWDSSHGSALDVGGGTGVMAQTIKTLFGLERVASVDVQNRFLPSLSIETAIYDGITLPFPDASFDCILLCNVLHHVPTASRTALIRECRRVAGEGPIYIKDHISQGAADDARLTVLDFLGNVPFHGMVKARYLRKEHWRDLATETGHDTSERLSGTYRTGAFATLFPNRLEVSMQWRPA
jgi:ubiquinone/menaquinone biosynthesis C-methylase UbiE